MSTEENAKPIHEIIPEIEISVALQTTGMKVAYPYIYGAPGGGKTACIEDMCKRNGWGILSSHFGLLPPEELGGIPNFVDTKVTDESGIEKTVPGTIWSVPDLITRVNEKSGRDPNKPFILFLDDGHLMSAHHCAHLYELLTTRTLRGYKINNNVAIVFAGNHGDSKAGAKQMFSAIINRVCMYPVRTSFLNWKNKFAINYGIHPAIISFLENSSFSDLFQGKETTNDPWPSPRSWTHLSNYIRTAESFIQKDGKPSILDDSRLIYNSEAHVGKESASKFYTYYSIFMKFNITDILSNIANYKLPNDELDRWALAYASVTHYCGMKDISKILEPMAKLWKQFYDKAPELALSMIHQIIDIEKITNCKQSYIQLVRQLNILQPGITGKLIAQASDAD